MLAVRFGTLVLALVIAYAGLVVWRLLRVPMPPAARAAPPAADVRAVKSDLCRLARAERAFFAAIGHYASEHELRSNGDLALPPATRWPYHYGFYVPVPDRFVIVASAYGPLEKRPPALVVDGTLQVCTITPQLPRVAGTLDNPRQRWADSIPRYECDACR